MLSNAYFLAKFRFDTAENEPAKNLQNVVKFANFEPSGRWREARRVSRRNLGCLIPADVREHVDEK